MKMFIIGVIALTLASCGPRRPGKLGSAGAPGASGQDGYSLVANSVASTVGSTSCNTTNIYSDIDRSGDYSMPDVLKNSFLTCDGVAGVDGQDGADGQDGNDGQDGADGKSSYEIALDHGFVGSENDYLDSLQGQQGLTGAQGPIGPQGPAAPTTYTIVEIIDPCGDAPGKYDEVILKLGNGQYLASFSDNANGNNTRLGILPTGNYVTTDGTGCNFSIP